MTKPRERATSSAGNLGFRRLTTDDLRLLHEWLQREHLRRWWTDRESYEEVVEHYLPAIDGREPTELYLILLEARPVGFIQTYLAADNPEWEALVGAEPGIAGVDLFIGEEELTGRGLGSAALDRFVGEIVFAAPETSACVADPDAENEASLRAFEKAGFRRVRDFLDPTEHRIHTLVRRDR